MTLPSPSHPQAAMDLGHRSPLPAHPSEPSAPLVVVASCVTAVLLALGFLLR